MNKTLNLFNTLSSKKEKFVPINNKNVLGHLELLINSFMEFYPIMIIMMSTNKNNIVYIFGIILLYTVKTFPTNPRFYPTFPTKTSLRLLFKDNQSIPQSKRR